MTDPVYRGPAHFWLIKTVLRHIFPGAGGNGFAKPITATEDEINYLSGLTGPLTGRALPVVNRAGTRVYVKLADDPNA
jgi:hypothetical protein